MFIGLAMAELASAAPTSGGVRGHLFFVIAIFQIYNYQLYFWTYSFSTPRWRNLLCWLVGCKYFS